MSSVNLQTSRKKKEQISKGRIHYNAFQNENEQIKS